MNASPLVCVPSKSRESRRLWVIQALVRSMTHLLGRIWKPLGMIASQSTSAPSLTHTARMPGKAMVDDIETHMHVGFDPLLEWIASIPAIRPDHLEARQLSDKRVEHLFAPFAIAAVSAKHFDRDQEALRIDQQMPFSALNFFSRRHSLAHRHEPNWFCSIDCREWPHSVRDCAQGRHE